MTNGFGDTSAMKDLFREAGIDWQYLTPKEQQLQFARTKFRPGPSGMRSAFYGAANPLLQQYYLQQPMMPNYGGFSDFMNVNRDWESNYSQLRARAEQAALMARMPGAQFFEYVSPDVLEDVDPDTGQYVQTGEYAGPAITGDMATWNPVTGRYEGGALGEMSPAQILMYRQTYGTAPEGVAAENQAQLANLLALQRGGGGLYGGPMGDAITSALSELEGQLMARDPGANFLDWYLQRTEDTPTVGGFLPG